MPDSIESTEPAKRPVGSLGARSPDHMSPTLQQDLSLLAWLQTSTVLSPMGSGLVCDALLQAVLTGVASGWPDPISPGEEPESGHVNLLVQVTERLVGRAAAARRLSLKLDLGRIGRQLSLAIAGERSPEALAEADREGGRRERELPTQPSPETRPDGSVR